MILINLATVFSALKDGTALKLFMHESPSVEHLKGGYCPVICFHTLTASTTGRMGAQTCTSLCRCRQNIVRFFKKKGRTVFDLNVRINKARIVAERDQLLSSGAQCNFRSSSIYDK